MKKIKSILLPAILMLTIPLVLNAQEIFDAVNKNDLTKVKELIAKDTLQIRAKDQRG